MPAFPSQAPLDEPADRIDDDVALHPGDNPYTYLNEDDEFTVDVTEDNPHIDGDGVNPDAFTKRVDSAGGPPKTVIRNPF